MTVTAAVTVTASAVTAAAAVTAASASAVTAASAASSAAVTAAHASSVSAPSRSRVYAIVIRCRTLGRLQHGLDSAMALAKGLRLGLCSRIVTGFVHVAIAIVVPALPPSSRHVWLGTADSGSELPTSPQSGSGSATPGP